MAWAGLSVRAEFAVAPKAATSSDGFIRVVANDDPRDQVGFRLPILAFAGNTIDALAKAFDLKREKVREPGLVIYAQDGRTPYTEVLALTKPRERAELSFEPQELRIRVYTDDYRPGAAGDVKLSAYEPDDPFAETDLPVNIRDSLPKTEK